MTEQDAVDLNLEAIFSPSLNFLGGRIRPALGATVNFNGDTSKVYLDARWQRDFAERWFAGIGLGFLLIEIAQLQRLSIFLGHPTYALTVVLFSLLVSSGIGSMVSNRVTDPARPKVTLVPLGALVLTVAAFAVLTPEIIERMDGATTPVRITTAVVILVPCGLLMGMAFPIGMRAASSRPGAPTAFLWGINGATSVCASVFGVAIAVFYGISTSYAIGVGAYVVAAAALVVIVRLQLRSAVTVDPDEESTATKKPVPAAA